MSDRRKRFISIRYWTTNHSPHPLNHQRIVGNNLSNTRRSIPLLLYQLARLQPHYQTSPQYAMNMLLVEMTVRIHLHHSKHQITSTVIHSFSAQIQLLGYLKHSKTIPTTFRNFPWQTRSVAIMVVSSEVNLGSRLQKLNRLLRPLLTMRIAELECFEILLFFSVFSGNRHDAAMDDSYDEAEMHPL